MRVAYLIISLFLFGVRVYGGTPFPPTNGSWLDIGPIVWPTQPWEENAVKEPQVYMGGYEQ